MADDRTTRGPRVRLIGRSHRSEAFELRDFLQRSVVAFDWVELLGDGDAERELDPSNLANVRLPVVELPAAIAIRQGGPAFRIAAPLQACGRDRLI